MIIEGFHVKKRKHQFFYLEYENEDMTLKENIHQVCVSKTSNDYRS